VTVRRWGLDDLTAPMACPKVVEARKRAAWATPVPVRCVRSCVRLWTTSPRATWQQPANSFVPWSTVELALLNRNPAVDRAGIRHLLHPQLHASPMFVTKTVNCGAVGSEANKGRIYETWNSTAGFRLNAFPDDEPLSEREKGLLRMRLPVASGGASRRFRSRTRCGSSASASRTGEAIRLGTSGASRPAAH
jgi:hypothetical protein